MVTTRVQQKNKETEERMRARKEEKSGAKPTPLEMVGEAGGAVELGEEEPGAVELEPEETELAGGGTIEATVQDPEMPGSTFSEDLFSGGR